MRWRSIGFSPAMLLVSFLVALVLAIYLLVTLLRPERF
ncbi:MULTISPECIES: K(+)-transporting ATPase subunit F [unclassified Devosia]|nr:MULTISPECIES: K(+)-transporting ATPase subunit F [unclassified Devosia]